MRWLIVLPFDRPEHMGVDFRNELLSMGHEVRTFAYRRNNPLYKNPGNQGRLSALHPAPARAAVPCLAPLYRARHQGRTHHARAGPEREAQT
jgi:hypothetical protein